MKSVTNFSPVMKQTAHSGCWRWISCPIACRRWVLPRPDAAVDEERVPARGGRLGHHARRRMGKLVGRTDHELVEGVALQQLRWPRGRSLGRTRVPIRDPDAAIRVGALCSRGTSLTCSSVQHLEVDLEGALGARFHVLEDRREEIVLEPLLVVAVRRPQTDAAVVDADTLDGAQPEIAVRGLHQRLDRADGLGPQIKHRRAPSVHSPGDNNSIMISGSITPIPPLCPQRKAKRNQPAAAHRDHSPCLGLVGHRATGSPRGGGSLSNRVGRHQATNRAGPARPRKSAR